MKTTSFPRLSPLQGEPIKWHTKNWGSRGRDANGQQNGHQELQPLTALLTFSWLPNYDKSLQQLWSSSGEVGEGKRGAGCFITHFDHEITGFKLQVNLILFVFLFKCVWSESLESRFSYIIIFSSSQDHDRNYLLCCGDWMWVHKFKFDGGLRKWDQAAAAAALSSSMMQFKLQVIARILFWTLNNIYIYIVRSELHMILCTTPSIKELYWLYSCRRVSVLLPKFSNTTPYPAVCWLCEHTASQLNWVRYSCMPHVLSIFLHNSYLKGSYSLHILWNMWDKRVLFFGYAMN